MSAAAYTPPGAPTRARPHPLAVEALILAAVERVVALAEACWCALLVEDGLRRTLVTAGLDDATRRLIERANLSAPAKRGSAPARLDMPWWPGSLYCLALDDGGDGALLLAAYAPEQPAAPRQLALLHALTDGLCAELRVTRQDLRVARLTEQLTTIQRLGQHTTAIQDAMRLFAQITSVIRESLGYDHTLLLLRDSNTDMLELAHASGLAGEQLLRQGYRERVGGHGIIGWVAGSGQAWISNDVARDPHYRFHALLPNTGSEASLPLRIGERIIGVLDVQVDRPGAFDEDDFFMLQTLADQLAPAIEHARLFAAERQERELATTLRDVSRIICASLELEQVLDLILSQLDRVVPHVGTRITLLGDDGRCHVVAAEGYPNNEEAKRAVFQVEDAPLAPLMIHDHQTVLVQDARTDPRWIWLPGATLIRSWCGAPLVIRDRCIGWLCVDWHEPGFYSDRHARIVQAFADQAAVAIENARLYAQVKSFNEQLEDAVRQRTAELHVAHDEIASKAQQLRALVHRVVTIQEAERQRIASDLHDGITQAILGAIYELQALRKRHRGGGDELDRRLDECQQLLDSTLIEMKHIIYQLRPRALDELGLLPALQNLGASIRAHHNLEVDVSIFGAASAYPLAADVELAVYRIVQEATQNSIRHAQASRITISIEFRPTLLRVSVADNGRGFTREEVVAGLGLVGIRERAQAVGGTLQSHSLPGQGTHILLEIPPGGVAARPNLSPHSQEESRP